MHMSYAFNAYHYIALGCAAVVLFIIIQYFSAFVIFVRSIFKRRASGKRAVERLRNLSRGEQLEPQPAVSTELPLSVNAEVEPILERVEPREVQQAASTEAPLPVAAEVEPIIKRPKALEVQPAASTEAPLPVAAEVQPNPARAEPLYSNSSQLLHDNIVQQNILDALIVDQLTDAVTHGHSEVRPAVSTEVPRPVSTQVEPILEPAELLEIHPAVSVEVPLSVAAEVQPILERTEPQVQPSARSELPLPVSTKVRPLLERTEPQVQPAARPELPLPVGSKVWAVCKFGSVTEGTPGIITGVTEVRFFWQSPMYLCTFANNMRVRARPKDIEPYNHAHSLEELKQSDFKSIQSQHMTLRAQQLLSR